jgi:hypothetical protein
MTAVLSNTYMIGSSDALSSLLAGPAGRSRTRFQSVWNPLQKLCEPRQAVPFLERVQDADELGGQAGEGLPGDVRRNAPEYGLGDRTGDCGLRTTPQSSQC